MTRAPVSDPVTIRRSFRRGDATAVAGLHDRVYRGEHARNEAFVAAVFGTVVAAVARGWPHHGGSVWLLDDESEERLSGSLGLTDEGAGIGRVRWFVLAPELRGRGLGRSLINELIREARTQGLTRLELDTFSALAAAAHIYRSVGFRVVTARGRDDWGPRIVYQRYVLDLEPGP
jgi:GNAT superfamily N-acetyltransferase